MNPYTLNELVLSDSSLSRRFHSCPRKFEFNKVYGHARAEREESIAADAGTALHQALQSYLVHSDKTRAVWELMKAYPWHLQQTAFNDRSFEACLSTFDEMLRHPFGAQYQIAHIMVKGEKRPAVEVPFKIKLANVSLFSDRYVPISYIGYIDAILWDAVQNRYVVTDLKTTRKSKYDYTTMFKRSPQCLPYSYVLEKALNQPADALDILYLIAYIDIMNPRVVMLDFHKDSLDIQQWVFSLAMDINAIRLMADVGFFPRNGYACDDYRTCVYNEVCDYHDPASIREYLDLQFGTGEDEPFEPWFELELTVEGWL